MGEVIVFRWVIAAVALCAAVLGLASAAHANLSIDKLWVEFPDGRPGRGDLVIRNDSDERYYIDVSVSEVLRPGADDEERVTIADPEALGLLVTPNRLILEPGALRSIRLVSLNENVTDDRIYRVLIRPQVGEIQAAPATDQDSPSIVMKVLAAYDVLVVVRPKDGAPRLAAERTGTEIALSNTGNTNVLISEGMVCPKGTPDDQRDAACSVIEAKRLYKGNVMRIALSSPDDEVVVKTRTGPSSPLISQSF